MAFDVFMKIETIPGESTDDQHKDWIELLSYSHAISQPVGGPASTAGGAAAERCEHEPFSVVKVLDRASPKLAEACCKGDHIKTIEISLNRAGGDKVEYMNYKLSQCMITGVSPGGSAQGGESLPLEEVTITYGKIEWTYTQQKRSDGTGGGKVAAGWDCTKNKAV